MAKQTFYDVLQVSRNADPETIKAAYKSLVQRYHPDKNPDNLNAENYHKEINSAYEVLSDPVKRAGYDAALAESYEDAATFSNESKQSQTNNRAENNPPRDKVATGPITFGRTEKPKQSSYPLIYLMYLIPGAAAGQLGKSLYLASGFNGSSASVALVTGASVFLGFLGGYALFNYVQTKIAKNRGSGILLSISISIGLSLLFFIAAGFVTQLTKQSQNPYDDPNLGANLAQEKQATNNSPDTPSAPDGNSVGSPIMSADKFLTDEEVGLPASPITSLQQTMVLAKQGNAGEQSELGYMYLEGVGIAQDYQEALKWFRLSAAQGNASAQYNLGNMHIQGKGVSQDYAQGMMWLRRAAEQEFTLAQTELGVMYANGQGVPQDNIQAVMWFSKAATQGDSEAQLILGNCYYTGRGVTQNYQEALKWFRLSAAQGNAGAQNNLGDAFENGHGIAHNNAQAMMWYLIAISGGITTSTQDLQQLMSHSTPAQIAEAQRMAREWWAAHPKRN